MVNKKLIIGIIGVIIIIAIIAIGAYTYNNASEDNVTIFNNNTTNNTTDKINSSINNTDKNSESANVDYSSMSCAELNNIYWIDTELHIQYCSDPNCYQKKQYGHLYDGSSSSSPGSEESVDDYSYDDGYNGIPESYMEYDM